MDRIDKIVFGDNQFFGINHMSQEKSQQLSEQFYDIKNIFKVYDYAIDCGIDAIMLNSNQRAPEICEYFRKNPSRYSNLKWYPSIPYPHKYANIVSEKGIFPAINELIFSNNTTSGVLNMVTKGSTALISKDAIKLMQMLIDLEVRMFKDLDMKVIFLQNIVTDLMLGYGIKEIFEEYCEYVRKKYHVLPGFITINLPYCLKKLKEWKIKNVVVCSSINKIGFTMSPNIEAYEDIINKNDNNVYQIMAMSTLASGAIKPKEAYDYINQQNIQSVVFGASSKLHIEETVKLINLVK